MDLASIRDYGALGLHGVDDTWAIQASLDALNYAYVPPGVFRVFGGLKLNHGAQVFGMGPATFRFEGAADACFGDATPQDRLNNIRMSGLTVIATGEYDAMFRASSMASFKLRDMSFETTRNDTAGIVTQKPVTTDFSWVCGMNDVRVRLPDASTARPLDTDMSDSAIFGCSFTGGIGSRVSGTGGVRIIGSRMDRSTGYALTIDIVSEARAQHVIAGNQIEEYDVGGVLLNGDANDNRSEEWVNPIIAANAFRGRGSAIGNVVFQNNTGAPLKGGLVAINQHSNAVPDRVVSGAWSEILTASNQKYTS